MESKRIKLAAPKIPSEVLTFILSVSCVVVPFLRKPIYYMEPDDYLLNYIANGSYGFEDSEKLIFIRIPIGWVLKGLYHFYEGINWYGLLLLFLLGLACWMLLQSVWRLTGSVWPVLDIALLELMTVAYFLTFTVVAFYCSLAGYGALYRRVREGKCRIRHFVWPMLLLSAGLSLRADGFYATTAICLPVCFLPCIRRKHDRNAEASAGKKQLLVLGIFLAGMILLSQVVEKGSYSISPWDSFTEFNEARSSIVDRPHLDMEEYAEQVQEAGISRLDYEMFYGWKFADKTVFHTDSMFRVGQLVNRVMTMQDRIRYAKTVVTEFDKWTLLLPVVVFFCLLFTAGIESLCSALWILLSGTGLQVYLMLVRMRFVNHVSVPISFVMVGLLLLLQKKAGRGKTTLLKLFGFAILFLFLLGFRSKREYSYTPREYASPLYEELRTEIHAHPEILYVIDGPAFSNLYYFDHPILKIKKNGDFEHIARTGSWDSFSGRFYRQAERYIYNPDALLLSLATEENMRFVSLDARMMEAFLKNHLNRDIQTEEQTFENCPFVICQFKALPSSQ